jgi:hypothetical protein
MQDVVIQTFTGTPSQPGCARQTQAVVSMGTESGGSDSLADSVPPARRRE